LGMKSVRVWLCVVALASVATVTVGAPLQAAETSTSTTSTIVSAPSVSSKPFIWSQRALTVGATLKVSKLVSSKIKGTRTYRATGACSVRNGVLRFTLTGKCRVTVSVTAKGTTKITRSSKLFTVKAKTAVAIPAASSMPTPIGCTKASSNPVSGTPYPDSAPGFYRLQTGWNCDFTIMDARPLLEYFKSQGWIQESTTSGTGAAELSKGSNHVSYGPSFDRMPEGQAFLILTIY
jgi:hypothetical protein